MHHTPGDWHCKLWEHRHGLDSGWSIESRGRWLREDGEHANHAFIAFIEDGADYELVRQRADAILIAAAPELLNACQFVLKQLTDEADGRQAWLCSDCMHPEDDNKTVVDLLKEAIKKAGYEHGSGQ